MTQKTLGAIISVIAAEMAPIVNEVNQLHIPSVIMELFQCIAWGSAGVMALVWVIKLFKDGNKNKA